MSTLVIVESPAKAKTIAGYLGSGFEVLASFGHVRDLPERADDIPADMKKQKWAKLGVNVEGGFEPLYIVPEDKKRHVANLRAAMKGAKTLLLATDEDREGESISWHILQVLRPGKSVQVGRIVFHEITPEAIREALLSPRQVDESLVRAQETRRILDRLFGYTLSPLLWKKVAPRLSAGRVQSVAVRLLVERERQRRAFRSATWWDLEASLRSADGAFKARLQLVDGRRLATGKSFDSTTGALSDNEVALFDEAAAVALAEASRSAAPWRVANLETREETERPPAPFMTSTLQQEANRKLRFASRRTMQIAQQLYEGVDLGGERVGLITYMRTDSLSLAERALSQTREVITSLYGRAYLPAEPARYKTKSKNAQEAHEAIRPTDLSRRPEDLKRFLDVDQLRLYELIWKRTIACQMVPARVSRTSVAVDVSVPGATGARALRFTASGKQMLFPGYLRAYVEGSDDPEAELAGQETLLPPLAQGQVLTAEQIAPQSHTTKPPARLTEASLVKRLEEAGVGRPSTYASIIGTVVDRGYAFKNKEELVPTFTGFAVTELLENHFSQLVDLAFTARMEDELDEIASGERDWRGHLSDFYRGDDAHPGLVRQVELRTPEIPFPAIPVGTDPSTGELVVVRVGRFGTFLQRGAGGPGNTASIPDDTMPADLTLEAALEVLRRKGQGPRIIAKDPATGRDVSLRAGRFGSYIELAQTEAEAASGEKPRRVSLPEDLSPDTLVEADALALLGFPRVVGAHPEDGVDITANLGRYGAYLRWGAETRNIGAWREALKLDVAGAVAVLKEPRAKGRRGAPAPRVPLRELGVIEGAAGPVKIFDGRYGPYVSDGTINASLPRGADVATLTPDEAMALLRARADAMPSKRKRGSTRGKAASGAVKGPAKKAAARKSTKKVAGGAKPVPGEGTSPV